MLLCACCFHCSFAQSEEAENRSYERAKNIIKKRVIGGGLFDFNDVGATFEKYAIANPGNPEAWYFLGYAIDKFNAPDGENIINSNLLLAKKAGECFQNTIELSNDKYMGEKLLLDPHSKVLSIWGGQAMRFFYENNEDSVVYCLQEARKRGGINETVLKYFSQMLDECTDSAYLFTSGDLQVYYIAYLQHVLKARKDVRAINLDYLNTTWYAPLMIAKGIMKLKMSPENLNAIEYSAWKAKDISIVNSKYPAVGDSLITWTVKPSSEGTLLRSDFIMLHLLQQNQMRNDVFFPAGLPVNQRLNINTGNYLQLRGITFKFNTFKNSNDIKYLLQRLPSLEPLSENDTSYLNNSDNLQVLNVLRFIHAWTAEYALQAKDTSSAKESFRIAEEKYPVELLPFYDDKDRNHYLQLKQQVENF